MLSETIKIRLQEKFDAPLPEFYKRRIVFWHDEDKEFGEDVNGLSLPGVSVVRLTGRKYMASDLDYVNYVVDQIKNHGNNTYKKMFGEKPRQTFGLKYDIVKIQFLNPTPKNARRPWRAKKRQNEVKE